jgi:hypothetical protein
MSRHNEIEQAMKRLEDIAAGAQEAIARQDG